MLIEKALVVSYQAGVAQVRFQPKTGCSGCATQQGCGVSALSALTGEKSDYLFTIQSFMPLKAGQWVEIGLPERSLLMSVFWLYVVPLLALVISTFLSELLINSEIGRVVLIVFCTALTLFTVRGYSRKLQQKAGYQPVLLRILN